MPVRAASASASAASAPGTARTTRPRRTATSTSTTTTTTSASASTATSADALASELDRVLRVAQRKAATRTRPTAEKTDKAPVKAPIKAPVKAPVKAATKAPAKTAPAAPTRTAAVRTAARPTKAAAPVPATTSASVSSRTTGSRSRVASTPAPAKGKAKTPGPDAEPESASAPEFPWSTAGTMTAAERVREAQSAISVAGKVLGAAVSGKPAEGTDAAAAAQGARVAFRILREICGESQGAKIVGAVISIVIKCLLVDMHQEALDMLVEAKESVLALYAHDASLTPSSSKSTAQLFSLVNLPPPNGEVLSDTKSIVCAFEMSALCCLISLGHVDAASALPIPASPEETLSFLNLAPNLSSSANISVLAQLLRRRAANLSATPPSSEWLHVRRLWTFLLPIYVSKSNPADKIWDLVERTAQIYLQERGDAPAARRDAAGLIASTVDTVEHTRAARGEARAPWYTGAWSDVADMWVSLGRTLGDSAIIDTALTAMTEGMAIAKQLSPPVSEPASASPSRASTPAVKTAASPAAPADLDRFSASLTKALVEVETLSKNKQGSNAALQMVLDSTRIGELSGLLCGLDDSEASLKAASTVSRAAERLRRAVVPLLDNSALVPSGRPWTEELFTAVEGALTRREPGALLQDVVRDNFPGAVDSASRLLRLCVTTDTAPKAVELADRIWSMWTAYTGNLDIGPRITYGGFIAQSAFSTAHRLHNFAPAEARKLGQRACDWTIAVRDILPATLEGKVADTWKVAEAALPKRYELLGFCSTDVQALEAYVLGLVNLPQVQLDSIRKADSPSLSANFADCEDATRLLKRVGNVVEKEVQGDIAAIVIAAIETRHFDTFLRGTLVEKIMDAIEFAQFRTDVQAAIVALCDYALGIYAKTYPVRRMRVLVRLMHLAVSTGAAGAVNRLPALADEVNALSSPEADLGADAPLAPARAEYAASALILTALSKYHAEAEPAALVARFGGEALALVRAATAPTKVLPAATGARVAAKRTAGTATRERVTRAPARTAAKPATTTIARRGTVKTEAKPAETPATPFVVDDINRFSQLLGSLASLFGLLGHVLPRLETLKALRSVLRTSDEMVDAHVHTSGLLAAEYGRLGKFTRASQVFGSALKQAADKSAVVSAGTRVDLLLRHAQFLATTGSVENAYAAYHDAEALWRDIPTTPTGNHASRYIQLCAASERVALAHGVMAAIKMVESDVTAAIESLNVAYRLWCRAAHGISRISADALEDEAPKEDAAATEAADAEKETSTTTTSPGGEPKKTPKQPFYLAGKHLGGLQWYYALGVFDSTLELVNALAQRGTVVECEYYLTQAKDMVPVLRSSALEARVSTQAASVDARRTKYEEASINLRRAADVLDVQDGPDAIQFKRLRGELYSRQQAAPEAEDFFTQAIEALASLDKAFKTAEAGSSPAKKAAAPVIKEPLLPHSLGDILRQRAWLFRQAGEMEAYEAVMQQLEGVPPSAEDAPEQQFLAARIAMSEAFSHFNKDLFMNSLTESTIAMTTATAAATAGAEPTKDAQPARYAATALLESAVSAFRTTLACDARRGRIEDVRQACVSLAMLGAYQTSLGQGTPAITVMAADMLASVSSLTLDRELMPAICAKYPKATPNDLDWPRLEDPTVTIPDEEESEGSVSAAKYWKAIAESRNASDILEAQYDLSSLPTSWAVVSITVTDDRNTMLVSRHQNGVDPLVFCIPLDRQGRREGEEESELFTFDAGIIEMATIMRGNDESIKSISSCKTMDDRKAWWAARHALDDQLGELLATIEFCWLGAFKTVLNPRTPTDDPAFVAFCDRLDLIFQTALSSSGADTRRGARVRLNDTLLSCFSTLSSKCKDEEVEDLVYFVLDQYQFHGVSVALAELDFDQIGVDVKGALAEFEAARVARTSAADKEAEHLLLVLDKNVQGLPWESLPILRGRAVSRVPSLTFLLDQVSLGTHLGAPSSRRTVDARRTHYFLNPGGDLTGTEGRFRARLDALEGAGWKGVRGRAPAEPEMAAALADSELVMYFGHGGGEEYIRGYKVRALPRCAVTMLWGCSSGKLHDQGGFDRTGTPYDYVLAGSPCLVANLWDVTDKDIDKVTLEVMDLLGLDADANASQLKPRLKLPGTEDASVVQAISAARSVAKLQFLTGAATVVYGIPVYIQ